MVEFDYLNQGIRLRGDWYPIVKMEWAEGRPLHEYISEHKLHTETLLLLLEEFKAVISQLRQNNIAHGDLQHANIIIDKCGMIRFVDYDGMYVPAFSGETSPELGHPNFQHPGRCPSNYDVSLDVFSSFVICLSIRAVAVDPSLWNRFHTGENLLFNASDFRNPMQSSLFRLLKTSPDSGVRRMIGALEEACLSPFDKASSVLGVFDEDREPALIKPSFKTPGCVVFLIDQSHSMAMQWGASGRSAADVIADMVNRSLNLLVGENVAKAGSCPYDIGLVGYGSVPESAFGGRLKGRLLVSLRSMAESPLRVEKRTRRVVAAGGRPSSCPIQFPVWLNPRFGGGCSLSAGFEGIYPVLRRWVETHRKSPPPIVFNITAGNWVDETITSDVHDFLKLQTDEGGIVVFNLLIGKVGSRPVVFPDTKDALGDIPGQYLFAISSKLPEPIRKRMRSSDQARCLVVNAGQEEVLTVLEAVLGASA
jgi:serine/threonine protein kinase